MKNESSKKIKSPIDYDFKIKISNEDEKLYKKKVFSLRMIRLMIFLYFIFLSFFIVGFHSAYLINGVLKVISLIIMILTFTLFILYLIKYLRIKNIKLKKRRFILNTLTILFVVCVCVGLTLLYGKKDSFRSWLITTAMGTMRHQYYCQIFYSESEINNVLENNCTVEPDDETNNSLVFPEPAEEIEYDHDDPYEVQLFKGHTSEEKYRMIRFLVNGQDAYMAVIYNPSKVSVAYTKYLHSNGEFVVSMAKRTKSIVAVNGGRFKDIKFKGNGSTPLGVTISKGRIISDYVYKSNLGVVGLNKDNVLVLYKNKSAKQLLDLGVRDAVTTRPFLIVNGKQSFIKGNGGYGYDARTAIGQREDGVILLLVVDANDTRTNGASMKDLSTIMKNFKCINAAALDGGTSSVMVEKGVLISDPVNSKFKHQTRPVATGIMVAE